MRSAGLRAASGPSPHDRPGQYFRNRDLQGIIQLCEPRQRGCSARQEGASSATDSALEYMFKLEDTELICATVEDVRLVLDPGARGNIIPRPFWSLMKD